MRRNHIDEQHSSLYLNDSEAAELQAPVELNQPLREQRSSIVVFLEMTIFAMSLKFAVSYVLVLSGMDEESWTAYILLHSILFPAGIFIGFIRFHKSFLTMPDLEKTKVIQWNVSKSSRSGARTLESPPFLTSTSTKTFSIFNILKGTISGSHTRAHTCKWSLIIRHHHENKDEFQFGLRVLELRQVQGVGLNVYFRINGKDMFISYQPFKKPGDSGMTSFMKIPAVDDDIAVKCQLQCIYFYL
ncbi:unnamed protein product [Allacma fusca]|uniref:Uncharacterized protein n=1 Tax=Allacma fusca TaxID=39272 RepID=A0A8J2LKB0_9HEXA|nr:unnamed protein product [Allacma fusca]